MWVASLVIRVRKVKETMSVQKRHRAYRARLRQSGKREILVALSEDAIAVLDQLQAVSGLRNRSAVAEILIVKAGEGRDALQRA
jgi:hypothetical protein